MNKIIILYEGIFQKSDYDRFGIKILKKNFFTKILDFKPWLYPNFWKEESKNVFKCEEYIPISKKLDFINFNTGKEPIIVIDFLTTNKKTNWIRKELKKRNSLFIDLKTNLVPEEKKNIIDVLKRNVKLIIKPKKFFFKFFKFFEKKFQELDKTSFPDILVLGGTTALKKSKTKNNIFAHSMDYDIYLNLRNKPKNNKDSYAVFLDEDMVNHPDYELQNLEKPMQETKYYETLTKFFKKFENDTKLKVKISVHPKSRTKNLEQYLKDYETFKENTAELVKNSAIVLLHCSTSISYAILFNKPAIFLTSNELKKSWMGGKIAVFSNTINGKIINMSNSLNSNLYTKDLLNFDKHKYQEYKDKYLKVPESPDVPLWEIITQEIKKYTNKLNNSKQSSKN